MEDQYCTLVYIDSFKLPDGTVRYSGVWHRTIPGPKNEAPKEEKPSDEKIRQALDDANTAVIMAAEAGDLDATRAELHGLLAVVYSATATPQQRFSRERLEAAAFYVPRWQEYLAARDAGDPMAFQYLHNLAVITSTFAPFPTSRLLEQAERERMAPRK
ncbi:MAG: hypothetical protein PW734_07275 [Verrucomicrobium sp.]|nr:hypothetical protein [Verrucomicrobium sp.]